MGITSGQKDQIKRQSRLLPEAILSSFVNGAGSGINFGGGVNYWMKERVGLRFEVRDYIVVLDGVANLVTFRVGILFR